MLCPLIKCLLEFSGATAQVGAVEIQMMAQVPQQVTPKGKAKKKHMNGAAIASESKQKLGGLQVHEIISTVKKTPFEDAEAQTLIDILLNKQAGGGGVPNGNGWVQPGNSGNEVKQLQRALIEKDDIIVQQEALNKNLAERMNGLRQELSIAKASQVKGQRVLEDFQVSVLILLKNARIALVKEIHFICLPVGFQKRHQLEVQSLDNRIQQEIDGRHQDMAALQSQIQHHVFANQQMQARLQQQQDAAAVFAELEQLRQNKVSADAEVNNLRQQLASHVKEVAQVKHHLSESKSKANELEKAKDALLKDLKKAKEEVQAAETKLHSAALAKAATHLDEQKLINLQSQVEVCFCTLPNAFNRRSLNVNLRDLSHWVFKLRLALRIGVRSCS